MSERDKKQLRLWLRETEGDDESVLGVEDEEEEDVIERHDSESENIDTSDTKLNQEEADTEPEERNEANQLRERDAKCTDEIEVEALIGMLYLCGVLRANKNKTQKKTKTCAVYCEQLRERDAKCTDEIEVEALIGMLYLCGVLRASYEKGMQNALMR
ncbi:hypothetical protein J6590_096176 [Homalodisca vitripennis]|nr:hypothetical protein J6590_096176 [Homalodisca vitripennis]